MLIHTSDKYIDIMHTYVKLQFYINFHAFVHASEYLSLDRTLLINLFIYLT